MEIKEYPEVKKWLARVKPSSRNTYLSVLPVYVDFTGLNPTQLIDEAEEDRKRSRRERGVPEQRLRAFYDYLIVDFERRRAKPNGEKPKGISKGVAANWLRQMMGFYKANGFPLTMKIPRSAPKKENVKLSLTPKDVKLLMDHAPTLRDRVIILMMFQGGFDVSTICSLNYGDVARELAANKTPMTINVVREKEEVSYYTYIGHDAIEMLKAYLRERQRNKKLKLSDPLFVKEGAKKLKHERITTNLIQNMLRDVAIKSGLVSQEEMDNADMNPARPHALRSAFSTILRLNGFNDTIVDFMMGHAIAYNGAYFIPPHEKLREMYKGVEHAFCISGVPELVDEKLDSYKNVLDDYLKKIEKQDKRIAELEERERQRGEALPDDSLDKIFNDPKTKTFLKERLKEIL